MSIISKIKSMTGMASAKGASVEDIEKAQADLHLLFANEYKEYLKEFGAVSANGLEMTGLNVSPRINVVNVTAFAREQQPQFPKDMYVIENIAVDGILVLQNNVGDIFEWLPSGTYRKIYDCIERYLQEKG